MNLSKEIPVACAVLVFVIAESVQSSGQSLEANPQHTSICNAIAHPERSDGKLVRFHAKYAGTFEGAWITDQKCKDKFGQIVLPFQHGIYDDVVHQASRRYGSLMSSEMTAGSSSNTHQAASSLGSNMNCLTEQRRTETMTQWRPI